MTTSNVVCTILNVNSLYNATCVCIVCAIVMLFHCQITKEDHSYQIMNWTRGRKYWIYYMFLSNTAATWTEVHNRYAVFLSIRVGKWTCLRFFASVLIKGTVGWYKNRSTFPLVPIDINWASTYTQCCWHTPFELTLLYWNQMPWGTMKGTRIEIGATTVHGILQ